MKKMKLAVCMAIFDEDNHLLLTKRNKNMYTFPNAWVLPGGHIDLHEGLKHGVIREIREETGIEIDYIKDKKIYLNN